MCDRREELLGSAGWDLALYPPGYGFLFSVVIEGHLKIFGEKEESPRELPPGKAISRRRGPDTEHVRLIGQLHQAFLEGVVLFRDLNRAEQCF